MRTTITIDDQLLAETKQLAARSHRTIGSVIEDALRRLLLDQAEASSATPVRLPRFSYERPGLREGVDLYDKDQIEELLSDETHALS
ncbi:MAG: type II toxin-antitoxin system VapB family antitoxin [Aeromicrobium sp.]|uniref:type II toxin-antitoxin system VapB family antitoxin n=1 Tax=Aeromicrobium sp. TaxID=1871063 RepID=UPI0039E4933A